MKTLEQRKRTITQNIFETIINENRLFIKSMEKNPIYDLSEATLRKFDNGIEWDLNNVRLVHYDSQRMQKLRCFRPQRSNDLERLISLYILRRIKFRESLLLQILSDFIESDQTVRIGELQGVLNVDELAPLADLAQHVVVAPLEVVRDLKVIFLSRDLLLDLAVRVVDDGEEHVEQHEEHEEDIGQEEDGSHQPVGLLQGVEVKVSKDGSKQGEDGVREAAVVLHLGTGLLLLLLLN